MSKRMRILMAVASLCMLPALFFPIWKISLNAPQYPEGLGLYIWAHQVTGVNSNDLNTLNGLNHYIGMKAIDSASIPELTYMPYIIGVMTLLGFGAALYGRRKIILGWVILLGIVGAIGLYDFYAWGYDYGHDLNPNAPIKVPGLSYQPPLIGSKQLLNINAMSLPYIGSYAIGLSALLAMFVYIKSGKELKGNGVRTAVPVLVLALLSLNCNSGPVPIQYGNVNCSLCEMTIMDKKFGSEIINKNGKAFYFDSMECMLDYISENSLNSKEISVYVTAYDKPEQMLSAEEAVFFVSGEVKSPMGGDTAAFTGKEEAAKLFDIAKGKFLTWPQVLTEGKN